MDIQIPRIAEERIPQLWNSVLGGEKVKKKSKSVFVVLLGLMFMLTLVSAMPVEAKKPLRWELNASYTFDPEWTGVVLRDDGSSGIIYLDIITYVDLPDVQHFTGIIQIEWDGGGGYIEGTFAGKVVWSEGRYVINGQITVTSDNWAHLNGRNTDCVSMRSRDRYP